MRFSYKRYIERIFHPDPKLSAFIVAWKNSHDFYQESLGNHLHTMASIFSILDGLQMMGCECLKLAVSGVKWGGGGGAHEFCCQDHSLKGFFSSPVPY